MKRIRTLLFSSFVLAGLSAAASLSVQMLEGVDRTCSVWSTDGRRVDVTDRAMAQGLQLDAGGLAPGIYFLRVGGRAFPFVKQ